MVLCEFEASTQDTFIHILYIVIIFIPHYPSPFLRISSFLTIPLLLQSAFLFWCMRQLWIMYNICNNLLSIHAWLLRVLSFKEIGPDRLKVTHLCSPPFLDSIPITLVLEYTCLPHPTLRQYISEAFCLPLILDNSSKVQFAYTWSVFAKIPIIIIIIIIINHLYLWMFPNKILFLCLLKTVSHAAHSGLKLTCS